MSIVDSSTQQAQGEFKKALGLIDSTSVVVGSMIGSGIFIVSAETARQIGSPFFLLLAWVLAGVLTVMAALSYSELASMFPFAGGQYVFLRKAYGPLFGFLYGWTLFMVIQSGTIAAVGVAFAKFLSVFFPVFSNTNILFSYMNFQLSAGQLVSVALIIFLTYINMRGIHEAKFIQTTFTVAKVGAILALIALGFFSFDKFAGLPANMSYFFDAQTIRGEQIVSLSGFSLLAVMAVAMVGPLFSCDAWNNITFAGEEVQEAHSVLPKSLFWGTLTVTAIYFLANVVYLLLLPLRGSDNGQTIIEQGIQYAAQDRVGTAALQQLFGPIGEYIMAFAILISTFGCLNGLILAGPRAYFAMARDGLFFKKVAILDPKTNVPAYGLILQGLWSAILATSGTYSNLLDYVVFAALLFYVLTVGAVFIMRRKEPDLDRPFKVPAYPVMPALYMVFALAIMLGQICLSPIYTGFGLMIIISGLPAYFIWHGKAKSL